MGMKVVRHLTASGLCAMALLAAGCVQTRVTEPARTAVEQLLLTTAADKALEDARLDLFNHRKVYVDSTYFEAYEEQYALGALRDALSKAGALLAKDADSAEIIIEPRAGALSVDQAKSLIGIPATGVPLPLAGSVNTPEIALYKSEKQFSVAKMALLAYERESREHFTSQGPLIGRAHHHYYTFLGYFKYTSTSLPEKKAEKWWKGPPQGND